MSNVKEFSPRVNNIEELQAELNAVSVEHIGKMIFRSTDCGCVFNVVPDGVTVCGYAEGADAECIPHELSYPFSMAEFYVALERADEEGGELFDEWNSVLDGPRVEHPEDMHANKFNPYW